MIITSYKRSINEIKIQPHIEKLIKCGRTDHVGIKGLGNWKWFVSVSVVFVCEKSGISSGGTSFCKRFPFSFSDVFSFPRNFISYLQRYRIYDPRVGFFLPRMVKVISTADGVTSNFRSKFDSYKQFCLIFTTWLPTESVPENLLNNSSGWNVLNVIISPNPIKVFENLVNWKACH